MVVKATSAKLDLLVRHCSVAKQKESGARDAKGRQRWNQSNKI